MGPCYPAPTPLGPGTQQGSPGAQGGHGPLQRDRQVPTSQVPTGATRHVWHMPVPTAGPGS